MVDQKQDKQDLVAWLADLGEGAIQRLSEAPGADRVLQALKGLGERVDELQRQTRGFADFEKRLTTLEKRVDSIAKPKPARKRKTASAARPPKSDATPKQPGPLDHDGTRSRRRREEQPAGEVGGRVEACELEQYDDGREPDQERDPEARPHGGQRGRDERAAQRMTARP